MKTASPPSSTAMAPVCACGATVPPRPTVTHMRNFENVRRTGDVINESIRYFSQQYMDMPINQALIDALTESVNTGAAS